MQLKKRSGEFSFIVLNVWSCNNVQNIKPWYTVDIEALQVEICKQTKGKGYKILAICLKS